VGRGPRLAGVEESLQRHLDASVGAAGVGSGNVVRPASVTQVREVLTACEAAGASVAPAGFPQAAAATVVIDGGRLDAVMVDRASLLLHAGGVTSWVVIRDAAAARRCAVSGLPSVRSDTAGQSVALGEIAHRTVAGICLLTPGGQLIVAGGRTLKDVVGYDLAGLALGSGDRLGMILALTLRLEPAAARTPAQPGAGPWRGDGGFDLAGAFAG
jgi:FAD/FMN-containing dehydrogenase